MNEQTLFEACFELTPAEQEAYLERECPDVALRNPIRRRVALKIVKLGMDTRQVVARFMGERQALAAMNHPFVAKVFDAGQTVSGRPYFVMELVPGEPLLQYCERTGLTTRQRVSLFIRICQAVQHAHQKGV